MDLFIAGTLLWGLIGITLLSFVWGIWKKAWKAYLLSGIAFLIPAFIFLTAPGWLKLLILLPFISFWLTYVTYQKN